MKARNLGILDYGRFNIPKFIAIDSRYSDEEIKRCIDKKLNLPDDTLFAVRSSAKTEDTDNKSNAGMFLTELNVPKDKIVESVHKVFESYPTKENDNRVIIQKMVNSEYSGILFTANPIGILNEMVINVGQGLGDKVVGNEVDVDTYYINKEDKSIYVDAKSNQLLSDKVVLELLDIGLQIEKIFGKYMDIEFAIQNNTIYILQARPITTLKVDKTIILDNSNIVESYPGVVLPLTDEFIKDVYYKIFKALVYRLSEDIDVTNSMDTVLKSMVTSINGRVYYEISNWYKLLRLLPFEYRLTQIWQKMLGITNTNSDCDEIEVSEAIKLKIIKNFIVSLFKNNKNMSELDTYFNDTIETGYNRLRRINIENTGKYKIIQLLRLIDSLKSSITTNWDITLINDMYSFIFTSLAGDKNLDKLRQSNLESIKPIIALSNLKTLYKNGEHSEEEFDKAFIDYIDNYGDRVLGELKLETKTYRTNPELLFEYLDNEIDNEIRIKHNKLKLFTLNPKIILARKGINNREKSRLYRSRLYGLARQICISIGEELVRLGLLRDSRDIFYIRLSEVEGNLDNPGVLISKVDRRKVKYKSYESMNYYNRITYANKVINRPIHKLSDINRRTTNTYYGIGISTGSVTGEVILVNNPDLTLDVNNKIIVTKSTDPGWIFLIKDCLGVVTERGSLLSHTAIVSRELNKPAIVNIPNITSILKSGDKVEIDGEHGELRILDRDYDK